MNERVGQMVPWVHAKLFGPWALRITIVPLGSANDKSSVRWAEDLRGAYSAWAKRHAGKSLKVTEIGDRGGDGGYPLDLIMHGDQWHWHELLRESGFHVHCGAGYDIAETLDPVPLAAWVNVTPISVATRRSVGAGLQYPDAPSIAFRPCLSCATSWPDGATDTASRKTASVSEAEALQSEEDGQSAATPKAQAEEPSAPVQPGASGHENEGGSDGGAARPARHPQIIRIYRFVREPQTDPAPPMQADPSTLQHIDTWVYGGGTKIMRAVPAIDSPLQSVLQKRQSADARRS